MRYAIVSETYPPEVNGVALTVQEMERGLRARGHCVDVLRPRQSPTQRTAAHERLVPALGLPRYPGLRLGLPAPGSVQHQWRQRRPAAVYIATEGPLGWCALRAARRLGIPVATGLHTRFDAYLHDYGVGLLAPLALRWMRHFHNGGDATLVPTAELADALRERGFDKVERLPRAVDTVRFDPANRDPALRSAWGVAPDGLAVVHVGRVAAEKNLTLAVDAFRALQERRPDARFVWVGEGPELPALRAANPDFVFCGIRRDEDLARHFASADLFLFPSHSETFGNVTLEAMASGVPTVAFRYGAAREHLLHGLHGAAIEDRDEDAFVEAACRLAVANDCRREMGRRARDGVRHLRPAQVAADVDALLQRIVDQRAGQHARIALA